VTKGMVTVRVNGRTPQVGGEYMFNHDPDFIIYARTVIKWDDGTPIEEVERVALLDELADVAAECCWNFEVSWEEFDGEDFIERLGKEEE
jgi:hypothetical protein